VEPLAGRDGLRVTVVDNACPQHSWETLAGLDVEIVHAGRNLGFGGGCNAGAARGTGEAILVLNPDARIAPESVRVLAARLERDAGCAAVSPLIRMGDGLQLSMRRAPSLATAFGEALYVNHLPGAAWATEVVRGGYAGARDAEWLIGAALLVRRSAFDQVGGFDERLFLYSEDTDLCTRLRLAGWRLTHEPGAVCQHEGYHSAPHGRQKVMKLEAKIAYARLHERGLRYLGFRAAFALGEVVRLPLALARSRDRWHLTGLRVALAPPALATPRSMPTLEGND
jgi:GT2 family glycosyltransferase